MKNKKIVHSKSSSLRTKFSDYEDMNLDTTSLLDFIIKDGYYSSFKKYSRLTMKSDVLSFERIMVERELDFVMKNILKVILIELESIFKNVFIHISQELMFDNAEASCYLSDFLYSKCCKENKKNEKLEILGSYFETVSRASKHSEEFKQYLTANSEPPIWSAIHQLTFGQFLTLYQSTTSDFKEQYTKTLNITEVNGKYINCFHNNYKITGSIIELMNLSRNIVMHDEVVVYGVSEDLLREKLKNCCKYSSDLKEFVLSVFHKDMIVEYNQEYNKRITINEIKISDSGSVLDILIIALAMYVKNFHDIDEYKMNYISENITNFVKLISNYKSKYGFDSTKNILKEHFNVKLFLIENLLLV